MLNLHSLTTVNPLGGRGLVRYTQHLGGFRFTLVAVALFVSAMTGVLVPATQPVAGLVALVLSVVMVVVVYGNRHLVSVEDRLIRDLVELHLLMDDTNAQDRALSRTLQRSAIQRTRRMSSARRADYAAEELFKLHCYVISEIARRKERDLASYRGVTPVFVTRTA